ncbi:MAG: DNRLRE domain-containing protein, partial [Clostridia bacterium]|nr:DNRLRE domain-containing protein [Clostridia bacterium]
MNEHEERVLHLVGEDARYRGENQKQFRREDGMRESIVYDHPVHYKKDGAWERIDNTLRREKGKDGKEVYRNTESSLEAELATELSAKEIVALTHKGKTLSWQIEGLEKSSKGEVLPVEEEKDHDQALIHPKELFSSVQYEKALHGADLVYELDSVLLRERIVFHNAEEGREKYVYTLNWDGEIRETEEGLLFCEGEETILRLHAPELIDNKGEWSETKTELTKTGAGEYTYTVTVPLDWLQAEERSYPVVLDPSVGVPFKDYIVDYHISSTGVVHDRDSLMVGSRNAYRSVIKPDLSTVVFPDDCFLQEADIVMSRYVYDGTNDGDTKNVAVQLYQLTATWPTDTSQLGTLYSAIDTTQADSQAKAGSANQRSSWDITEIGRKWNAGQDTDKGLLLKS